VQSLAPISSSPLESAVAGTSGAAETVSVLADEDPDELQATTAPEHKSKKKIAFFMLCKLK
jgi:hypothetical protein